jgi:hypothetical protein
MHLPKMSQMCSVSRQPRGGHTAHDVVEAHMGTRRHGPLAVVADQRIGALSRPFVCMSIRAAKQRPYCSIDLC